MDKSFWQEKLNHLPVHPGVYLFKDGNGTIIYVGKAESLNSRVTSCLLYTSDAADEL